MESNTAAERGWKRTSEAWSQISEDRELDRLAAQLHGGDIAAMPEMLTILDARVNGKRAGSRREGAGDYQIGYPVLREENSGVSPAAGIRELLLAWKQSDGRGLFTDFAMHRMMERSVELWLQDGDPGKLRHVFWYCQRMAGRDALAEGLTDRIGQAHDALFAPDSDSGRKRPPDAWSTAPDERVLAEFGVTEDEVAELTGEERVEYELERSGAVYPWKQVQSALLPHFDRYAAAFPEVEDELHRMLARQQQNRRFWTYWFSDVLMRAAFTEKEPASSRYLNMAGDLMGVFRPEHIMWRCLEGNKKDKDSVDLFYDSIKSFKPYKGEFRSVFYITMRSIMAGILNYRYERMNKDIVRLQHAVDTDDYSAARMQLVKTMRNHIMSGRDSYYDSVQERFLDEKPDGTSSFSESVETCVDAFVDTYRRAALHVTEDEAPGRLRSPELSDYTYFDRDRSKYPFVAYFTTEYDERNAELSKQIRNQGLKKGMRARPLVKETLRDFTPIVREVSLNAEDSARAQAEQTDDGYTERQENTLYSTPAEAFFGREQDERFLMTAVRVMILLASLVAVYRTGTTRKPESVPGEIEKVKKQELEFFPLFYTVDIAELANAVEDLGRLLTSPMVYSRCLYAIDEDFIGYYANNGDNTAPMSLADSIAAGCRPLSSFDKQEGTAVKANDPPCAFPMKWLVLQSYKDVKKSDFSGKKRHYQAFLDRFFDTLEASGGFLTGGASWLSHAAESLKQARVERSDQEDSFLDRFYTKLRSEPEGSDDEQRRETLRHLRTLRAAMLYKYERGEQNGTAEA